MSTDLRDGAAGNPGIAWWTDWLAQSHQQFGSMMNSTLAAAPLDERSKAQWGFAMRQVVDAMSPTVNTISPGYIGTKMVTAIPKEVLDSKILPHIPVGRLGKPEEVAGLIIYLASEEAAFVTGANIAINGGQHMQ